MKCFIARPGYLERDLSDAVADGRLTVGDADAVRTFGQFLHETPLGVQQVLSSGATGDDFLRAILACFGKDRDKFVAWRDRWGPYMRGETGEPTADSDMDNEVTQ